MARSELVRARQISIPVDGWSVPGELCIPEQSKGVVLFVHGTGSSHLSPRNQAVALTLQRHGFATVLFDLVLANEPDQRIHGFDIEHLTQRVVRAMDWVDGQPALSSLPLALYGASSGAAIAVEAAVKRCTRVMAVVSRGGRIDLAFEALASLRCPLLLLVGELDVDVLELNAWAESYLRTRHELRVIPGASHLFAEPGTLENAAEQTATWLDRELGQLGSVSIHTEDS